jgi:hypothetical protein
LTAYLPGIASVVNSFQSPEVQMSVYRELMSALEDKTRTEEDSQSARAKSSSPGRSPAERSAASGADQELVYDLVDGESIHAVLGKG